jgi:hypothetical protein
MPTDSPALAALRSVDPNSLSPRQALDLVFHLQKLDCGVANTQSAVPNVADRS